MSLLGNSPYDEPVIFAEPIGTEFVVEDGPADGAFEVTVLSNGNAVYVWLEEEAGAPDDVLFVKRFDNGFRLRRRCAGRFVRLSGRCR